MAGQDGQFDALGEQLRALPAEEVAFNYLQQWLQPVKAGTPVAAPGHGADRGRAERLPG